MVHRAGMEFDLAVTIGRPPAVVFALLLDVGDYGDRSPRALVPVMKESPPGPT